MLSLFEHHACFVWCVFYALTFSFVECVPTLSTEISSERIVNDLEIINSANGLPLDFSYNETNSNNEQHSSAPGCPQSIDGYPWIYSASSPSSSHFVKPRVRCYLADSKGPCPNGQALFIMSGSRWGVCGCECLLGYQNSWAPVVKKDEERRMQICYSVGVQQIFDKDDKSVCYNVNEQGPCPDGKVVVTKATSFSENRTSKTGFSVACLPPCEEGKTDTDLDGGCASQPPAPAGAPVSALDRNDCPANEKFSTVLRKCVKRKAIRSLIIG